VKLRITGLFITLVPPESELEVVDADEDDDDVLEDDDEEEELMLLEDDEEEVLAVFEVLELPVADFEAVFVVALDLAFAVAVDWALPLVPEVAVPVVPVVVVVPLVVVLVPFEPVVPLVPEFVPVRLVPFWPLVVPPTRPSNASTSQRTTVFVALSIVPFSTTYSTMSPSSTSTRRSVGRSPLGRKDLAWPDFHAP
jgi:hypothetical protein